MPFTVSPSAYQGGTFLYGGISNLGKGIGEAFDKLQEARKEEAADQMIFNHLKANNMISPEEEAQYLKGGRTAKSGIIMGKVRNFAMDIQQQQIENMKSEIAYRNAQREALLAPPQILSVPTGENVVTPLPTPRPVMPGELAPNPFTTLPDPSTLPQTPGAPPSILPPAPSTDFAPSVQTTTPQTVKVLKHGGTVTLIPGQERKAISARAGQIAYDDKGNAVGIWDEQGNVTKFDKTQSPLAGQPYYDPTTGKQVGTYKNDGGIEYFPAALLKPPPGPNDPLWLTDPTTGDKYRLGAGGEKLPQQITDVVVGQVAKNLAGQTVAQPNFLQRIAPGLTGQFQAAPTTPDEASAIASQLFGGAPVTSAAIAAARATPTPAVKTLTREIAQQFLNQARGDKQKARALARDAGYAWPQ